MPRKITRQEYNSLLKEDRKQDYTATIAAKLGDYEYSKGNPTSSDPETQKKLDNIMKMCNLFKEAANDVKMAPDADKSFVLSSAKIRMKSYDHSFSKGKTTSRTIGTGSMTSLETESGIGRTSLPTSGAATRSCATMSARSATTCIFRCRTSPMS